jgi:UTP-glucose-1-phosphate uridylyltransferase
VARLDSPARLAISSLVEKPSGEAARASLRVPGLPPDTFLTAFGLYIVTHTGGLMRSLDEMLKARGDSPAAPPLQLTEALNATRIEGGLHGVLLQGERCDIGGEPQTYLRAIGALVRAADGRVGTE